MLRLSPPLATLLLIILPVHAAESESFQEARSLYQSKHYGEARVAFQDIVYATPENAAARHYLGRIAMKQNQPEQAIEHFEKSTQLNPDNSDYFADLGEACGRAADNASVFAQIGFAKKCRAALEKSVELNPDNLAARRGLVDYYRQAPSFLGGGVLKAYDQAEEIRQRDLNLGTLILGQLYVADHRFEEAIALFVELTETQPDNYLAHYSIGRIAAESGEQRPLGITHLQKCLQLTPADDEPSHAAVHWRLGNLAERDKAPAQARTYYEQALQIDPHFAQAAQSLADLE